MGRVFIGTSGFSYKHWQAIFYPLDLPQKDWFSYYTKYFDTVELNVSFYRLPKRETFVDWREKAGPPAGGFVFSVKGNRYITHVKKLKDCKEAVERFFKNAEGLRPRAPFFSEPRAKGKSKTQVDVPSLTDPPIRRPDRSLKLNLTADQNSSKKMPVAFSDVILWQLPPNFKINIERLREFLTHLRGVPPRKASPRGRQAQHHLGGVWRHAFEFRDESWNDAKVFKLLRQFGVAVVFQDFPDWPIIQKVTADFVYLRFHGKTSLYSSCYTEKELREWARKIRGWLRKGLDVYAYFNNDALGYAVENAKQLISNVKSQNQKRQVKSKKRFKI